MRAAVLLGSALLLLALPGFLAFPGEAHAAMQPGRVQLAQRILSCGEQANTWYLLYAGTKCNTSTPIDPQRCKVLMDSICSLVEKCERAKVYCIKPPVVAR